MNFPLALAIGAPSLAAIGCALAKRHGRWLLLISATTALVALATLYPAAADHGSDQVLTGWVLPGGLHFRVGGLGWLLAATACLVWLAAGVFSCEYMAGRNNLPRYYGAMALSLGATVGVALAADLLTLLACFETMTFASYLLVVHEETPEARQAGNTYLYLGAAGGSLLMAGTALAWAFTGSVALTDLGALWAGPEWARALAPGLLIAGFGVKAGMVPLHVWLPQAHPAAPSPASAILSGILIKTGAYGIIRVTATLFPSTGAGYVLVWFGTATMLLGVGMALLQANAKRMLAYHSVSQMGYILMGIGAAAYLGHHGAVAIAGAIYHLVNHALFKSALFIMAGTVYLHTHELDMYKLGGLGKRLPLIALFGAVACLGIAGFPGFNGYISKTLLHHAIVEAAAHGGPGLAWAERLFVLTGMGTACSFIKLFGFVFLGKERGDTAAPPQQGPPSALALGLLSLAIVLLGAAPHRFISLALTPALHDLGLHGHELDHLTHLNFFGPHDLQGIAIALAGGLCVFIAGVRLHLFHLHPAPWLSVEYLVRAGALAVGRGWLGLTSLAEGCVASLGNRPELAAAGGWRLAQRLWRRGGEAWGQAAQSAWRATDSTLSHLDHDPGESRLFHELNAHNLNFANVVVALALAVLLLFRILR
ncbi:MAG: complex I subunit 5 family protein [Bacillota bacterium]